MRVRVYAFIVIAGCQFQPTLTSDALVTDTLPAADAPPVGDSHARDASSVDAAGSDAGPFVAPCMSNSEYPSASQDSNGNRYRYIGSNLTYDQATAACEADGAQLATVTDAPTNTWIATIVGSNGGDGNVWIGFDDLTTEGTFTWESGAGGVFVTGSAGSSTSYTNWNSGEPNDGGSSHDEDCAYMLPDAQSNMWNDTPCGDIRPAVCECVPSYHAPPIPPCMTDTTPTWQPVDGRLYQLNTTAQDWQAASDACTGSGAYLLVTADAHEAQNVPTTLAFAHNTWIGFHDVSGSGHFTWVDGAPVVYTAFESGQPDSNDDSAEIEHGGSNNLEWSADKGSTNTHDSICECDPLPP